MKDILLESGSKKTIGKVAEMAAVDPLCFAELIKLMKVGNNDRLAANAAWALSIAVEKKRVLVEPYFRELIKIAGKTNHPAIKRNIVRIWSHVEIPVKHAWEIADICYRFLCSPDETIAVKAFSITALHKLVRQLPELYAEVRFEIEKQLPHSGPAFKVRAKTFLNDGLIKK